MRLPGLFVPSLWDSIYMKSYPALPCRAIGYAVPSGLLASGDLRFLSLRLRFLLLRLRFLLLRLRFLLLRRCLHKRDEQAGELC
jgi:hypothetical protein